MKRGFSTKKYLIAQTKAIKERLSKFDNKLYLEFGGKLLYDGHASRVLPGYEADAKVQLLKKLKNLEVIYCISAKDIERGKIRQDTGLTYDSQALNEIREIRNQGLNVSAIVITLYENEKKALKFRDKLKKTGEKVYLHPKVAGYPKNMKKLLSKEGLPKKPFIKTKQPLVIVTGTGGNSGKMAVCIAQLFNEQSQGINAGYAKFETFPVWNMPIDHPLNIAYEAATADLGDKNIIDPYHLKYYQKEVVNYNRDIENFWILKKMIKAITLKDNYINQYHSPTDMGVNMVKAGIVDDKIVKKASKEEIVRRFYRYQQEYKKKQQNRKTMNNIRKIMKKAKVDEKKYPLMKI
ncbi:DUF1846 family protein [Candidatus Woesearchaeota archaeon]|jgi:uncharacterized protein (UPF0371 family)|nr:DUF1846 family protein [Candidatus Woesearchaeota archaeon]MBT4110279.1 DUF1846 family protein [Candidatus Woesearchaeota archaeon]MBT4336197.1 DUF1846 family protein [Candidatus Woesearchaeota archaeon]MBT4468824.1 DUF1846 family protein [Candidatus Woesearchaeota archaeon]MBT6744857.1 DUF1846 family protein [Candidatus Woesearchaeota archaeon]